MGKKRKGKAVRKNRERSGADEDSEIVHAPHSFVIHRGATGKYVQVGFITTSLLQTLLKGSWPRSIRLLFSKLISLSCYFMSIKSTEPLQYNSDSQPVLVRGTLDR